MVIHLRYPRRLEFICLNPEETKINCCQRTYGLMVGLLYLQMQKCMLLICKRLVWGLIASPFCRISGMRLKRNARRVSGTFTQLSDSYMRVPNALASTETEFQSEAAVAALTWLWEQLWCCPEIENSTWSRPCFWVLRCWRIYWSRRQRTNWKSMS